MSDSMSEGAAIIGAAPGTNTGPSFRVVRIGRERGVNTFKVISSPYPLHWAMVLRTHITPGWLVCVETAQVKTRRFDRLEMLDALHHAGLIVGALYRVDMRSKFTGPQRYVMGRNLCPGKIPCDGDSGCGKSDRPPGHYHLCKRAPGGPTTVWCEWHAEDDSRLPGDVFRSLDDSAGGDPLA